MLSDSFNTDLECTPGFTELTWIKLAAKTSKQRPREDMEHQVAWEGDPRMHGYLRIVALAFVSRPLPRRAKTLIDFLMPLRNVDISVSVLIAPTDAPRRGALTHRV